MDGSKSPERPLPSSWRTLRPLLAAAVLATVIGANSGEAQRARAAAGADISSPVDIAEGNCSFGPAFDRAFENMIFYRAGGPRTARPVVIGGQRLSPRLTASREESIDDPSHWFYRSSVRLSRPVRWNGLRLTGLSSNAGWEWAAQSLEFADRPERVRDALRAIGLELPLPPASRDIPTDACSAAIPSRSACRVVSHEVPLSISGGGEARGQSPAGIRWLRMFCSHDAPL